MEVTLPAGTIPLESQLSGSAQGRRNGAPEQTAKVAREFEAMMVGMMLKAMRETVGKDKLTGGGRGEETFRSLLDQEYATAAARGGGIGLARVIERELKANGGAPAGASLKGSGDAD